MKPELQAQAESIAAVFLEAVAEVAHTVLTNQRFFPARDLLEVKIYVQRLFPETPAPIFEQAFHQALLNPDLPWGKRRFYVVDGLKPEENL